MQSAVFELESFVSEPETFDPTLPSVHMHWGNAMNNGIREHAPKECNVSKIKL